MKRFLRNLCWAWSGIAYAVHTQRHMRIHLGAVALVSGLAAWLQVDAQAWCWLVVAMSMVISAEVMNTAVEVLADRVTREQDELIGHAKDAAAGAVLVCTIGAVIIGLLVLGPRLWEKVA
jgi:diacylglycerol kinase